MYLGIAYLNLCEIISRHRSKTFHKVVANLLEFTEPLSKFV